MINSRKKEISSLEIEKIFKKLNFDSNKDLDNKIIYFLIAVFLKKTKNKNNYLKEKLSVHLSKNLLLKLKDEKLSGDKVIWLRI